MQAKKGSRGELARNKPAILAWLPACQPKASGLLLLLSSLFAAAAAEGFFILFKNQQQQELKLGFLCADFPVWIKKSKRERERVENYDGGGLVFFFFFFSDRLSSEELPGKSLLTEEDL